MDEYKVNDHVVKHSGGYGGPGIIRGIISTEQGPRYIVAHEIKGGWGEMLHIYSAAQIAPNPLHQRRPVVQASTDNQ